MYNERCPQICVANCVAPLKKLRNKVKNKALKTQRFQGFIWSE